jgi:DNA-binding response OmpR family regulator
MKRILIIEDEKKMQAGLRDNLEIEGYAVDCASDGTSGLDLLLKKSYDCVILDVMLPGISGFDLLRRGREQGVRTPVIMLTARGEEVDKVLGLELGADDYITKPFSLRELLARVKAVLRRSAGEAVASPERMDLGSVVVDFAGYSATRDGKPIEMTPKEIEILKFLWYHRNQTVTREQLLASVWGYDESISTRTVDNFIAKLRQKIEPDPASPKRIITIHGVGYKLVVV